MKHSSLLCVAFILLGMSACARYERVSLTSSIDHVQPMTGLVLSPRHEALTTYQDAIALEDFGWGPNRVVVGKEGDAILYNWAPLDSMLDAIAARKHQAVLRWRYEYPGNHDTPIEGATGVPQYIKDLPDYHEPFYRNPNFDGGDTYYADWTNKELQWFTMQFYTDFAARYGNDPRLAFLEVGFGHWGEYHIYATPLQMGVNFPSKEYQTQFLHHMAKVMPMPWAISIDAADAQYTPIVADAQLMALPFGLFDDSFMHEGHELSSGVGDNETNWNAIGGEHWKTSVYGGEVSYYTHKDQYEFLNPAGLYGVTWEEAIAKYHITFMMANDAPGEYGTVERFNEAGIAAGYSFRVLDCQTNGRKTKVIITNEGVAPIYYDAYMAIGDIQSQQSLKGLLPKDTIEVTISAGLEDGNELTIACQRLVPGQEIQFNADIQ